MDDKMSDAPTLDECLAHLNYVMPRLNPQAKFSPEFGHKLFDHKKQLLLLADRANQSNESADRLVAYEAKRKAARIEQFLCQNGYYMNVD